jgi:hypothetical protein
MWRRVDLVWIYVSKESIASIFRVEKSASEEPAVQKTVFFIITAVKTSNLISPVIVHWTKNGHYFALLAVK